MESDFRFGIWERLSVAGFIVGVAGLVASGTLPPDLQEALVQSGLGHALFWGSAVIILAAILFFICDLAFYILSKKGVKVGIALASIGTVLIILGALVGLIGAFKIDSPSTARRAASTAPDVTLRFVYPERPAVILINNSDVLAKQIKWTVVLWNL